MAQRTLKACIVIIDHRDADLPLFPFETIRHTLEHEARRLTSLANERLEADRAE